MTSLCGVGADTDSDLLPDYDDPATPPLGDAWFYLVTSVNELGEGPLAPPNRTPPYINDQPCP